MKKNELFRGNQKVASPPGKGTGRRLKMKVNNSVSRVLGTKHEAASRSRSLFANSQAFFFGEIHLVTLLVSPSSLSW